MEGLKADVKRLTKKLEERDRRVAELEQELLAHQTPS